MTYTITCPYCFEKFDHTDVHFRSERVEKESFSFPRGYANWDSFEANVDDEKTLARVKAEYYEWNFFRLNADDLYENFWKKFGKKTETNDNSEIKDYQRKVIDPKNPEHKQFLQINEMETVLEYQDGFATGIRLKTGEKCLKRVCPKCHNPLPPMYGQHETKFISVVGVSGSGKTVYLSQLLYSIHSYAEKVGLSAEVKSRASSTFIENNKIVAGKPLPSSTPFDELGQPLFYDLTKELSETENKTYTIVLYDIAGENFHEKAETLPNFGPFVAHSDGMIYLVSPDALSPVVGDRKKHKATEALETMHNNIPEIKKLGQKSSLPLAVCFSQVDREDFEAVIPKALSRKWSEEVRAIRQNGRAKQLFNATDYYEIGSQLSCFIQESIPTLSNILNANYQNYNYFGFSALGCEVEEVESEGVKTSIPMGPVQPLRVEEPLLWLFNQFCFIGSDSLVFKSTRLKCPECQKLGGEPIRYVDEGNVFWKKLFAFFRSQKVNPKYRCVYCGKKWGEVEN